MLLFAMVAPFQQPTHIHIYYTILYLDFKMVYVDSLVKVVSFRCLEAPDNIFSTATACNNEHNSLSELGFMKVNVSCTLWFLGLDIVEPP
jgi:hypothetical protein